MAARLTRRELLAGAAAALATARLARAESRPTYGGRAVASLASAPASFDPAETASRAEAALGALLYDTLYRLDASGRVEPHLAAALPSLDALVARIPLRPGVALHDGKELRAADVVAALKRAQNSRAGGWALAPVRKLGRDGDSLVVTLSRPTPELGLLLAVPALAIATPGPRPVGTGPFRLARVDERRVELAAFAGHFAGRPPLDTLSLRWFDTPDGEPRAYEAGDLDVSERGAVAFAGHRPKYPTTQLDGPATLLVYLGFGQAHARLFGDVAVRRGVSLAVARQGLRHLGSGERILPVTDPESPDLGGRAAEGDALAGRPEQARTLLGKVGGSTRVELILDRSRPDDAEIAARIIAALDRAGLVSVFKALEPREYARRVAAGQCDLYLGQLPLPTPDPGLAYAAAFAAGGDRWAAEQLARQPLARDVARAAFFARLPVVPLFYQAVRAHHQTSLFGLAFDPLGRLTFADAFRFAGTAP